MNKIINKSLLAGHKSMPEIHLGQPGSAYRLQKFKETRD